MAVFTADAICGGRTVGLSNLARLDMTARHICTVLIAASSPGTPRAEPLENPAAAGRCCSASTLDGSPAKCVRGRYLLVWRNVSTTPAMRASSRGAPTH